jgi:hypothetical protein
MTPATTAARTTTPTTTPAAIPALLGPLDDLSSFSGPEVAVTTTVGWASLVFAAGVVVGAIVVLEEACFLGS